MASHTSHKTKEEKDRRKGVRSFLVPPGHRLSRLFSFGGLAVGAWLLLASVQVSINVSKLLQEKNPRKNGYDYISISKMVTNDNMGSDHRFAATEIESLKNAPEVTDVAALYSNQFRTKASAGSAIPFSTDLFIESIRNDFIDTVPVSFNWKQGQSDVPIIFSADFLEMYNVFAATQDLPQFSEQSIGAINIQLECYGQAGMQTFSAHIVAVSDRINTVLVPETFLHFANKRFAGTEAAPASRVYLKTVDANNSTLLHFLESNQYRVNKDKTKFGRIKIILQGIVGGLAFFAILVIALAMMLFAFYLQLMIAKSKENLVLLKTLGYSPEWLGKIVSGQWIPVYAAVLAIALLLTQLMQAYFSQFTILGKSNMTVWLHPIVWGLALLLFFLCMFINKSMVRKALHKI